VAAIDAPLDMAAQRRGAARRDGAHDAAFDTAHVGAMGLPIGLPVAAQDIRHLDGAPHGAGSDRWDHLEIEAVERARSLGDRAGRHLGVQRRGRQVGSKRCVAKL
jgi:hypothetical protein